MQRALDLALLGQPYVSPNPLVGCVIVKHGNIIAEGYHRAYGKPHAEIEAINHVRDKADLKGAELFVNLEPCFHHGKTPPCVETILKYSIKTVYIANIDPNPLVFGKSILKLRKAGVNVIENVLAKESKQLNRAFFYVMQYKRPYIILKWAKTKDGFLAHSNYDSKWISNDLSRLWVHKWRSQIDAILVGTRTVLYDNPQLTTRDFKGPDPLRLIIDKNLKLPTSYHVFDQTSPTICYNLKHDKTYKNLEFKKLPGPNFLMHLLQDLSKRRIQTLMVEGGANLLQQFITLKLWQEARVFQSPKTLGEGIPAPYLQGLKTGVYKLKEDQLTIFCPSSCASAEFR